MQNSQCWSSEITFIDAIVRITHCCECASAKPYTGYRSSDWSWDGFVSLEVRPKMPWFVFIFVCKKSLLSPTTILFHITDNPHLVWILGIMHLFPVKTAPGGGKLSHSGSGCFSFSLLDNIFRLAFSFFLSGVCARIPAMIHNCVAVCCINIERNMEIQLFWFTKYCLQEVPSEMVPVVIFIFTIA